MKIFSDSFCNEYLFLQALNNFRFEMPYQNLDEIFSTKNNIKIEKFDENTWKIENSVLYRNNISGLMYSSSYVKDRGTISNLLNTNRKIYNLSQKVDAICYAEELLKKGNITVSPDDITSIFSFKNISDISQFEKAWNKLSKFNKISVEETASEDILKLFIIKGKLAAIYGVLPAFIIGDGLLSINELIEKQNKERMKNILYKNYKIKNTNNKISQNHIPEKGEIIKLKETTKISNGAILVDLTNFLKKNFSGLTDTFDNYLKDIDFLMLTCVSDDFNQGWNYKGFKVREIYQNKADFSEYLACATDLVQIKNQLSFFKDNENKKNKKNILSKSNIFNNSNLRSALQTDIIKEAAYRKGLRISHIEPTVISLEHEESNTQVVFNSGMTSKTKTFIREFTNDKFKSKSLLENYNINTPKGFKISIDFMEEAWEKAKTFNSPVVVKPLDGSGGAGVSTYISTLDDFKVAWNICREEKAKIVLVEECVSGNDYRIVVVDNKVCAVTQRIAAYIVGDGVNSISQLIELKAEHRKQNPFFSRKIFRPNAIMIHYLLQRGLHLDSIPKVNEKIQLLDAVNIGSGGESIDQTDNIHPDWINIAVNARKAVLGPYHVGLDLMAEDISKSPHKQKWSIIEVNTNPDLGLQIFPEKGFPRDIGMSLLDNIFGSINPNIKTYSYSVYGKVQGVGYRKWLKKICDLRSVTGNVQNSINNVHRVDIIIKGPEETLKNVIEQCYKGSQNAIVKKICFSQENMNTEFKEFTILN
ncbi:hypothetical protein B9T31_08405 [Acinetobacter sp. ANC 4558]|uniref:acylphosphatase n=1 Tax=Acinetobacter sp. ANC 4558 TaxID=1977876 RepID=UPI000A32CCEC|nr:acylphosphatase [Acinetobacter sp. ANC 4558]OTG86499.1 hypothetical protein B9T31_08405 [Acinetobacter sp. ANC 4558]